MIHGSIVALITPFVITSYSIHYTKLYDPTDGAAVAHLGDTDCERGKHQGGYDHLDEAQKDVGQDGDVAGKALDAGGVGYQRTVEVTCQNTQHHANQDGGGQFVHFHLLLSAKERVDDVSDGRRPLVQAP